MASKRMFSRDVIGSDAFAECDFEAQALYFHLGMEADDWGFVTSPKRVQRSIGASPKALAELERGGFVLTFGGGALCIAHWWVNNSITEGRRKATQCADELATLEVAGNGVYQRVCDLQANCEQTASKPLASLDETRLVESRPDKGRAPRHAYGEYRNVMLSDDELAKLKAEFPDWQRRIDDVSCYCASRGKAYRNYLATIRNWARRDNKAGGATDADTLDAIGAALGA